MAPVKVAVLGAGYFGSLHAKVYSKLPEAQLVAVCDHDQARAEKTASAYGAKGISDLADLPGDVEAVSIAVPTTAHYTVAKAMLERGLHILVEKPVTTRLDEVDELDQIAKARGLIFQVGHLERFNPVMLAAREVIDQPRYLECRRISPFPDRGTDVNVVLDLMIHDLDLVLSLVPSELVEIDAIGVPVLTPEEDIANARLRFADGCTANITASRVSRRKERVIRVFQHDCYLVLDLQDSKLNIIRRHQSADSFGLPDLETDEKKFEPGGNLDRELAAFLKSVRDGSEPLVTAQAARRALAAALEISAQLKKWNGAS